MAILRRPRAALIALAMAASLVPRARAEQPSEQAVKAAFLYNFTRFVEWPSNALPAPAPFTVCVVADGEMTAAVEQAMKGESVQGHRAETRLPQSPEEARGCQVLFLGRAAGSRMTQMLSAVAGRPVLTVGEGPRFLQRGGVIQFVLEQDRVRFEVDLNNARRARLNISTRLLRVAKSVTGMQEPAR